MVRDSYHPKQPKLLLSCSAVNTGGNLALLVPWQETDTINFYIHKYRNSFISSM
ncbi:hypothetical protein ACRRTK_004223 [Alexandromys fortis]